MIKGKKKDIVTIINNKSKTTYKDNDAIITNEAKRLRCGCDLRQIREKYKSL